MWVWKGWWQGPVSTHIPESMGTYAHMLLLALMAPVSRVLRWTWQWWKLALAAPMTAPTSSGRSWQG